MSPRPSLPHRPRPRATAGLTAGVTALVLVAGCTGTPSSSETTGAAGAPGGTLVVGVTTDPDTLFPWKATQFQAVNVLQNIYGTLTEFDKDLNVVPGLAESWKAAKDGRPLTLTLRQGVTFGDGSAFDSKDVKHSLDAIMDEDTAAVAAASLSSVESVEAPDPHTVVLNLNEPDAALPANLATVNMAMLSSTTPRRSSTRPPTAPGRSPSKARREPVDHAGQEREVLGQRETQARRRRVPGDPRRVGHRLRDAVGQRPARGLQRPPRRADRAGRLDHRRQDPAAQLPRPPAQHAPRRPGRPQRTAGDPVRRRPQAGARHRRAQRGRGDGTDHRTRVQVEPPAAPLPRHAT